MFSVRAGGAGVGALLAGRMLALVGLAIVGLLSCGSMLGPATALGDSIAVSRITPPSPFPASCPMNSPFADAEAEFSLAADPRHTSRLVTAWIQGAVDSVVSGHSADGGRSFSAVILPALQQCTGGQFEVSSDPWISEGSNGTAYLSTIPGSAEGDVSNVWVSRSRNHGRSWLPPVFVDRRTADTAHGDDAESVTADPFRAGHAYVVWSDRASRPTPGGTTSASPEAFFSRTSDGGAHWSKPGPIAPEPPELGVARARIVVPAPGRLVCIYTLQDVYTGTFVPKTGQTTRFMTSSSSDEGRSWGHPRLLGQAPTLQPTDPGTGNAIRAMAAHNFADAVDLHGDIYLVWADIRHSSSRLRLVISTNKGRTWRRPRDISGRAVEPLFPDLAVGANGTIGLTFYDWRGYHAGSPTLPTRVWFRRSTNRGRTWQESQIGGPFDLRSAPLIPPGPELAGYFLGEYQGLTGVPDGFVAVFAQARPKAIQGQLDGFAARIHIKTRR